MRLRTKIILLVFFCAAIIGSGIFIWAVLTHRIFPKAEIKKAILPIKIYTTPAEAEFIPDEIIVKFKSDLKLQSSYQVPVKTVGPKKPSFIKTGITSLDRLNQRHGIKQVKPIFKSDLFKEKIPQEFINVYRLKLGKQQTVSKMQQIINEYLKNPHVEYAEPNYIAKITATNPNDTYADPEGDGTWVKGTWGQPYEDLWGLKKIKVDQGWDIEKGNESVIVAVIDTGVDYNHEDLAANIWINLDEFPDNAIDDDKNGYIDDVKGWDFVGADMFVDAPDKDPMDFSGHGTHVAGIIAAIGNNQKGVIGLGFQTKVMIVKTLDNKGRGGIDDIAQGVIYAADNGAKIINMSLSALITLFGGRSQTLANAISYAYNKNIILIAAAGNDNADAYAFTPAQEPKVIAIAATDSNDQIASFSNRGEKVELSAPGVDILSLRARNTDIYGGGRQIVGENYYRMSGTSMAAPFVAGLAALILSKNPNLTNEEIRQVLINSADDLGLPGKDPLYGYGRINVYKALSLVDFGFARIEKPELLGPFSFNPISGTVDILGKTSDSYQLSAIKDGKEITISSGQTKKEIGVLGSFDTKIFRDGPVRIKLIVKNNQNKIIAQDEGLTVIDNAVLALSNISISPPIFSPNNNGFNDKTTLTFDLSEDAFVMVFVSGKNTDLALENAFLSAGTHAYSWNGESSILGKIVADDGIYEFSISVLGLGSLDKIIEEVHQVELRNTLSKDNFDRSDGNPGIEWNIISGNWKIKSQKLYQTRLGSTRIFTSAGDDWTDYTTAVSCMIKKKDGYCGLLFRIKNSKNFYALSLSENNRLTLYKVVNGSWIKLSSKSVSVGPNIWYHLKIIVYGNSIKGYLNKKLLISKTDSTFLSGKVGLNSYKTDAYFDNFTVLNR